MINSAVSQVTGVEMAFNIIFTSLILTLIALSHIAVRWCGSPCQHRRAANDLIKEGETLL